jgi:hypothetical protein
MALDAVWTQARTLRVPTVTGDTLVRRAPLSGVFASVEPAVRRPARQPLWIDSNGLPAPRIQPPTLQIPGRFEATLSVPVQPPGQFLVALPSVLQMPRRLLVDPPGAPALPSDFVVSFALAPTIPSAFEVALPPVLGIPSRFEASTDL